MRLPRGKENCRNCNSKDSYGAPTHSPIPLKRASIVRVRADFKDKHSTYYVTQPELFHQRASPSCGGGYVAAAKLGLDVGPLLGGFAPRNSRSRWVAVESRSPRRHR